MARNKNATRVRKALDKALRTEAREYVDEVKKALSSGSPGGKRLAPNRPLVVYRKRSNKPLIDRGDLRNSIRVKKVSQMEYFGGVSRTAKRRKRKSGGGKGGPLVDVAKVHEFGKVIVMKITPKMHRWFFWDLARSMKFARRRKSAGTKPESSRSAGKASPSFKPGATLVIRIKPRPFMTPVFDRRKKRAPERILGDVADQLGGDFGRM